MSARSRARAPVVAALLLATVAGCAADPAGTPGSGSRGTPGPATPTTAPSTAEPQAGQATAVAVRLVVSGGITGAREVVTARRGEPPPGMSRAALDRLLTLAGSRQVLTFDDGRSRGAPCCDVRTFEVTVTLADGRRVRVRASELGPLSPQLRRLVTLMSRTG